MIRSMTAFARKEAQFDWGSLRLELRSVNHRYLEQSYRLPDDFRPLEMALRDLLGKRLGRGKVEVSLRYEKAVQSESMQYDKQAAERLAKTLHEVDKLLYNASPVNAVDVLKWPGILDSDSLDMEQLKGDVMSTIEQALAEFIANREREGDALKQMIEQRLAKIEEIVASVRELVPQAKAEHRQRLLNRLSEVKDELDPQRLEQEMVIFAQKSDVEEELDRLIAHVDETRRVLGEDKPVGRRLDFIMQEFNREANTLGSKSIANAMTQASVDLKVLIEQMREQVQNIE